MFGSLISVLLDAIDLMFRSFELELPPPLRQMAPTMAAARSYRKVSIITQAMDATVHMSRTEVVMVRAVQAIESHMMARIVAGGLIKYYETISTEADSYSRQDRQGTWLWKEPPGPPGAKRLAAIAGLATDVQWRTLDEDWINGQPCLAYQAIRAKGEGAWEQALLWIAQDSLRPVEMLGLNLQEGRSFDPANPPGAEPFTRANQGISLPRPQTLSSQVVTWSNWDDPVLSIPSI